MVLFRPMRIFLCGLRMIAYIKHSIHIYKKIECIGHPDGKKCILSNHHANQTTTTPNVNLPIQPKAMSKSADEHDRVITQVLLKRGEEVLFERELKFSIGFETDSGIPSMIGSLAASLQINEEKSLNLSLASLSGADKSFFSLNDSEDGIVTLVVKLLSLDKVFYCSNVTVC